MTKQNRNGFKHQCYLATLTAMLATSMCVNAEEIQQIAKSEKVQAVSTDPISLPKKPSYPPVKPGYYQGNLTLSGHGGNMVTGETPVSRFSFMSNRDDYELLTQAVNKNTLPERNQVSSHQLINRFDYQFPHNVNDVVLLSNNYVLATELAPSPYNRDTELLLINIELTKEASDKAALGFNWLQATVNFNPRLVSEYRLIGFENAHQTSSHPRTMKLSYRRQYVALYELRFNESIENQPNNSINDSINSSINHSNNDSIINKYSANELATLSLSDARSTSGQQLIKPQPIDIHQQQKFFEHTSNEFRFAAAVAGLGQLMNMNNYVHDFDYQQLIEIAEGSKGEDFDGERAEFIALAKSVAVIASDSKLRDARSKKQVVPPHEREPYPMPYPIKSKHAGELPEGKQKLILPVKPVIEPVPKPLPVNNHI